MNHKEITGWDTFAEYIAYEKGRKDEENVIAKWIEKWDFKTNSEMGNLLMKKIKEYEKIISG